MRILHTADWHLGKAIYGCSLLSDQRHFIHNQFLPLLQSLKPDLIVISGDVFDRQIAPIEAIRLFDEVITAVTVREKIPMAVIAGNHDGLNRMALGAGLLQNGGLHIASGLTPEAAPVVFHDAYGEVHVHLLPYFDPAEARALLVDEEIRGFNSAYRAVLGQIKASFREDVRHVLAAHCFVGGSICSESESPLYIGGSGEVDASVFEGFDYVALGHLHAPQRAGSEVIRYAGSPLKYSFDEAQQKKGMNVVELKEKGCVEIATLPVIPLRDMRIIEGTMDELLAADDPSPEDYLFANITDQAPVYEPMARLRRKHQNLLGVRNEWLLRRDTKDLEERDLLRKEMARKSGDKHIFEAFMRQVCALEPDDDDRALFQEIRGQLGAEEGAAL